jgi:predicted acyltransferase
VLAPTLSKDDIVIMDNLASHEVAGVARNTDDSSRSRSSAVVSLTHARASRARLSNERARLERNRRPAAMPDAAADRVVSLDALRGFAMFWIIAGDSLGWALHDIAAGKEWPWSGAVRFLSAQLMHVEWEGFTFYDFLFPLFVFVTGVSIVFSLPRLVERQGKWAAHERVLRRSILLFVLGLIYYGGASNLWPDIRLAGVLQRIALCYLFASLLFLNLDLRGLIVAFVSLLLGYWVLMTFVPVPWVGAGSFARDANLANWIDAQYLPGLKVCGDWDPEGLLSTLPAIGTCLLGVFAGMLLKDMRVEPMRKVQWFIGAGAILVASGYLWSLQFPVIKNLWTSSFVLVAGGYSLLLLGLFYLLVDLWGRKAWVTIFLWFGANAIALYMINNFVGFQTLASRLVGGDVANFLNGKAQVTYGAGSLAMVTVGIALAIVLAGFLYRRKIFLRV